MSIRQIVWHTISLTLILLLGSVQCAEVDRNEVNVFSIQQPYIDKSTFYNRYFNYGGDTLIRSDKHVRLTQDRGGQRGWYFSKFALYADSFQIEFEFSIHGKGVSMYGDGMAFWMLKGDEGPQEGTVFGLKDNFEGLAIFIDTYKNDRPGRAFPYVMAMLGDGKTRYDAEHDGAANELGGCSARGLHNSGHRNMARLTYVPNGFLSLELNYKGRDTWEKCFVVEGIDLKGPNYGKIGFSAQTGELSENHELISSKVYKFKKPPKTFEELQYIMSGKEIPEEVRARSASYGKPESISKKQGGSWGWFFVKFLLFIMAIVGGYVGYSLYRAQKTRKREAYYL